MFAVLASFVVAQAQPVLQTNTDADLPDEVYLEERMPMVLGWGLDRDHELDGSVDVVGGTPVTHDDWPDVAAVVFDGQFVGCTGTLIASDLVLTAAHCADGISHVILDTADYATPQGEMIAVSRIYVHSSYYTGGYDIAVLELSRTTSIEPRRIATDCVRDEHLYDGADVAVVGYGAINEQGTQYSSKLHEGFTTIDDAECDQSYADGVYMGCAPSINPGGEIGAGGDGVDACFGDSGGPLYLLTPDGEAYLSGVTSRAYAGIDPSYPCRDGGIFVRADAVMGWVEQATGRTLPRPACNAAPQVDAPDLVVPSGGTERATLSVDDDGSSFSVDLVREPAHGVLEVGPDGVTYTADAGYVGPDSFEVEVTDDGRPYPGSGPLSATEEVSVEVVSAGGGSHAGDDEVSEGDDDFELGPDDDDVDDDDDDDEGGVAYARLGRGCTVAPTAPGALGGLLVAALAATWRRRRS